MVHPGYRKRTIVLLVGLLLIRFWFGQTFELSGQEAYLWLQGHNLSPAYWGRGPFVPWLIHFGTLFFGDTELGVRWLAAVIACLTGFVLFYLARHWFTARAAFWTVVLYVIVPMFAWKLSFMTEATASIGLMGLAMLAFCRAVEEDKVEWWLLGGLACGLGMLVAMSNVWWLIGLLVYFAIDPARRPRLREPLLWMMIILTVLFLAPVIWWWHGPQVADMRRSHLISEWPLSHAFSLNKGFNFIWLELFYLSPLFFLLLVFALGKLGRELRSDSRYSLLACLALPGLAWQNFSSFFQEGRFELVPALFLPLVLLVGCCAYRIIPNDRSRRLVMGTIYIVAAFQSLAGLNPFYFTNDEGRGWQIHRTTSGENVTGFHADKRQISWRNLADQMVQMQREVGANLIIADSTGTASALTFYMPRNPTVYLETRSNAVTQFDFWTHYNEAASPNDSALYITRANESQPPDDLVKNFTTVEALPDPPIPEFDKAWNIWNCQKFTGEGVPAGSAETGPMRETDSLPKQ